MKYLTPLEAYLLNLLAEFKKERFSRIIEASGYPVKEVRAALDGLMEKGYVERERYLYSITSAGIEASRRDETLFPLILAKLDEMLKYKAKVDPELKEIMEKNA